MYSYQSTKYAAAQRLARASVVCALRAVVCADAVALVAWLPLLSLQVFSHFHRLVCFNR